MSINQVVPQRFHALQALRAYAAAMVVSLHGTATYFYFIKDGSSPPDALQLPLGELGVKLFFVSAVLLFSIPPKIYCLAFHLL